MLVELRLIDCYPKALVAADIALICIDGVIAVLAFYQLMRVHSRTSHVGWTRQKVFHLMIGSSNAGYFLYFVLNLVAGCKGCLCWSYSCGFIIMGSPEIIFLSAFLLLLSYWIDLCHQSNDEDDEDEGSTPREALLEKINKLRPNTDTHRRCCPFRFVHVGSRQKVVILVSVLVFVLMMASAMLSWIGMENNSINSSAVERVYVILFAIAMLLLGGAMACYGLVLFLKMRKVRSERASSEMWKVAGLAIVCVLCFTSSAFVALFTDIPVLYQWHRQNINGVYYSLLLLLYYFIGSSVPSATVIWVMRELPPFSSVNIQDASRTIAVHRPGWTVATSLQNQVPRETHI